MRNELSALACLASLSLVGTAQATSVTALDDNFDLPSYTSFSFNGSDSGDNIDDVSIEDFSTSLSGGNPDGRLIISHAHDVDRDEFGDPIGGSEASIQSFFSEQTASYTPTLDGEILSITFSIDVKTTDPFESIFFEISDTSGGSVVDGGAGFLDVTSDGVWNTYSITIEQSGAPSRDFAGSEPLAFGFGFTSSETVDFEEITYTADIDNFVVTITQVPEPGSMGLVLGGLALIARRRRS